MTNNPNNLPTDIRGLSNLTVDGVLGLTDLVESLHATILRTSGAAAEPEVQRTRGIAGLVYKSIRTITKGVGKGVDVPLSRLSLARGEDESPPGREAAVAVLNGVLGDHLVAKNNPLAIPMQFRQEGRPLSKQTLSEVIQQSDGKLAIMVHGLGMNDLQWKRQGHDHGAALARDLGVEPLYLHYNTGRHISENGREFSDLLQSLVAQAERPLTLIIVAHSMGGLVARSACYYGEQSGCTWLGSLQKMLFLGTPHHGAPLEKGGSWVDVVLGLNAYSAPFSRLGKVRSSGTTDLRYGNVVDEDWNGRDRFGLNGDQRVPVPLPQSVACYAIAATTSKGFNVLGEDIIGDGLVMVSSALGHHKQAELNLSIPETQQWVGQDMNHLDLLNNPAVYEKMREWLGE